MLEINMDDVIAVIQSITPQLIAVAVALMLGIIVDEGKHSAFANKLIENGVLAITAGKNAVRLLPPLVISKEEMDEALAVMAKVF